MATVPGELFAVGVITGTWGNRGMVKVAPRTDFPDGIARKRVLWLRQEGKEPRMVQPTGGHPQGRHFVLALAEVSSMDEAELLRGAELLVEETDLERLPEGSYYHHQIIGLRVEDTAGRELGRVVDIMTTPAHDLYVVRGGEREILVPAVAAMVRSIDPRRGLMTVDLPAGATGESGR